MAFENFYFSKIFQKTIKLAPKIFTLVRYFKTLLNGL